MKKTGGGHDHIYLKMTKKNLDHIKARFQTLRTFNILVSQASLVLFMGVLTLFLMEL